jgi:hypothetical protein
MLPTWHAFAEHGTLEPPAQEISPEDDLTGLKWFAKGEDRPGAYHSRIEVGGAVHRLIASAHGGDAADTALSALVHSWGDAQITKPADTPGLIGEINTEPMPEYNGPAWAQIHQAFADPGGPRETTIRFAEGPWGRSCTVYAGDRGISGHGTTDEDAITDLVDLLGSFAAHNWAAFNVFLSKMAIMEAGDGVESPEIPARLASAFANEALADLQEGEEASPDPDAGRELQDEFLGRLVRQRKEVEAGERGEALADVVPNLCRLRCCIGC